MDINSILHAEARQLDHSIYSNGDADAKLKMSLLGQLYVADWKTLLAAAGRMYTVSVPEHATGGGALTLASGNAAVDLDQPEYAQGIAQGYRVIPCEFEASAIQDMDAYDDLLEVYLFADRTQTQTGVTGTEVTPQNHLDGGDAYPAGNVWSIVTTDLTDPVHSEILTFKTWKLIQVAAESAGSVPGDFYHHKVWEVPKYIAGPASIIGIVAGTTAPTLMATFTFGVVPSSWFPTS